jgi:hypothetical protein
VICPDDSTKLGAQGGPLSYVVNGGCYNNYAANASLPVDWRQNGSWNYGSDGVSTWSVSFSKLIGHPLGTANSLSFISSHDGTATTLSLSENIDVTSYIVPGAAAGPLPANGTYQAEWSQCMLWDGTVTSTATLFNYYKLNNGSANDTAITKVLGFSTPAARPSSNHPGGDCVLYCDGHTSFIADTIPYNLYATLLTSNGAFSLPAGKTTDTNNPTFAVYQVYPLDAASIPSN